MERGWSCSHFWDCSLLPGPMLLADDCPTNSVEFEICLLFTSSVYWYYDKWIQILSSLTDLTFKQNSKLRWVFSTLGLTWTSFQSLGDLSDLVLGLLRPNRPGQLRADRHQGVHQVLGSGYVREFLCHQHHRPAQPPHRHDEPLLPADQCELGKVPVGVVEFFFLCFIHVLC